MGDKSPKATQKKTTQKNTKVAVANQSKAKAAAAAAAKPKGKK